MRATLKRDLDERIPDTHGDSQQQPSPESKILEQFNRYDRMTVDGSMRKIGYLLGLTVVSALVSAVLCLNAINNGNGGSTLVDS